MDQGQPDPTFNNIEQVIVRPSAKIIDPRRKYYRYAVRPKGHVRWGTFAPNGDVARGDPIPGTGVTTPPPQSIIIPQQYYPDKYDSWKYTWIRIWGEDFSPIQAAGRQVYYWVTIRYKVLFRGRQQTDNATSFPASKNLLQTTDETT